MATRSLLAWYHRAVTARSLWAWGDRARFPDDDARRKLAQTARLLTGGVAPELRPLPDDADARVPPGRATVAAAPAALAPLLSDAPLDRAAHAYGRGYPDLVRGFAGDFAAAPDLIARPRDAADLTALLDWCSDRKLAAIPYGGGTSVVGGVELPAAARGDFAGVVTIDLERIAAVTEVEPGAAMARIGAGARGPALEAALATHGLTLRHYPQSFEFSTLGGWLATRAGGHFATGPTHIDEFCAALTVVTPRGVVATRRLPASGAGPQPERLWLGSEGALGVITEAWMRVQRRPRWRAGATVKFRSFAAGLEAVRALAQSGLQPANCRLLDPAECLLHQVALDGTAVLIVGFESADHPPEAALARALVLAADHGGAVASGPRTTDVEAGAGERPTEAGAWRQAFVDAPYLQSALVSLGVLADTFETACPWDRLPALHAAITAAVSEALRRTVGGGLVACRLTHAYADGAAPYYTFVAPTRIGDELAIWREVKAAASDAILASGGTITHHHAVGRVHHPWYLRERPALFGAALAAVKRELDPAGVLNPGVLV